MSAFLGPIHYWLYNKIQWHEGLQEALLEHATSKGIDSKSLTEPIYEKYGMPDLTPLANAIDHGNIHGWLQERIGSVEGRIAGIVTELMKAGAINKEQLVDIYSGNGKLAAENITEAVETAPAIYKAIFDYLLEGMPCDRVNVIVTNSNEEVVWATVECLHKRFWDEVEGNVENYYLAQEAWILSFVEELNPAFEYVHQEDGLKIIRKK